MIERIIWATGAFIYLFLGSIHLYYTFFSNKFSAKDLSTNQSMQQTHPRISSKITMWNAWIGFNASHSIGGIFFGITNIYFAISNSAWQYLSLPFMIISLLTSLFYLFLGIRYWFGVPRTGILLATFCFIIAIILLLL